MDNKLFSHSNHLTIKGLSLIFFTIFAMIFLPPIPAHAQKNASESANPSCIWQICSIDTMKVSRDEARIELNNPLFDTEIQKEVAIIKSTGANYVTVDTPYDNEFLPYLRRWVQSARKENIHIWFRGNWSSWEGWFDYPKNMTPSEHLASTSAFIKANPDIFQDGDIFDACPECENAGHWTAPQDNESYNQFLQQQNKTDSVAFATIGKKVNTHIASIVGGFARGVLNQETIDSFGGMVSIDHYVNDPSNMQNYLDFFHNKFQANVLVSEFGAPIPGITADMSEDQQANFVNSIYNELYKNGNTIIGTNYWVLTGGSSPLLNSDGSPRKVFSIIKNYFTPGVVSGKVTDPLGKNLENIMITASGGAILATTDKNGQYTLPIPPRTVTLNASGSGYTTDSHEITIATSGAHIRQDFVMSPTKFDIAYLFNCLFHQLKLLQTNK